MKLALEQGKIHQEMQVLEKVVEKRDSDIQQLQKQLKEAEHILVSPSLKRLTSLDACRHSHSQSQPYKCDKNQSTEEEGKLTKALNR